MVTCCSPIHCSRWCLRPANRGGIEGPHFRSLSKHLQNGEVLEKGGVWALPVPFAPVVLEGLGANKVPVSVPLSGP